jgi:hypothetical protein
MFKSIKIILFASLFAFCNEFAFFNEYEDAVTKKSNLIQLCEFEGLYIDVKYEDFDSKTVEVYFIMEKLPSNYFTVYDSTNKVLTIEFYDATLGKSIIESIDENPILKTKCSEDSVDLNENIEGLQKDIRKRVKVEIFFKYNFDYKFFMDEYYMFHLKFNWDRQEEKAIENLTASRFNVVLIVFLYITVIPIILYLCILN